MTIRELSAASDTKPVASEPAPLSDAAMGFKNKSARRNRRTDAQLDIAELRSRVYDASDLSGYSFRDRMLIYAADWFIYLLIFASCSTIRWEVKGGEHADSIFSSGRRAIFTSWHTCLFSATWFWRKRGIVVMSSRSRDAEFTGRIIKRFGYGTARGSSTRGAGRAMTEMAACLKNQIDTGFTIDGPRGPAFIAKPGAVTLARHTGQAILPFHITVRRSISVPSWDRLQIPLPFTRALVLISNPIYVAREGGPEEATSKQTYLQATLERLRAEGEAWRER